MTHILRLPSELLFIIAKFLLNQADISSFMRTSRILHLHFQPFLYKYNVQHGHSSALLWAARSGNTRLVKKLLDLGTNLASFEPGRAEDEIGYEVETVKNPLINAAEGGHTETLKAMLSETRPDRAPAPCQLRTVLHWAIRHNNRDLMELMLSSNAPLDANADTLERQTALDVAIISRCDITITERLLQEGAQPTLRWYPDPFEEVIRGRQTDALRLLLEYRHWPVSDEILGYVVERGETVMLQLLIDHWLDVEVYGHSGLFAAVTHGRYDMAKLLIEMGANPHLICQHSTDGEFDSTSDFYSTIRYAIKYRHLDILQLLMDKGVRPDRQDLQFAKELDFQEAVDLLSALEYDNDMSVKVHLADFVSEMEEERKADPKFHPMQYTTILDRPFRPMDMPPNDGELEIFISWFEDDNEAEVFHGERSLSDDAWSAASCLCCLEL